MSDTSTSDTSTGATPPKPRSRPKVPPFARYQGTSAWRKDKRRVRAYAWFLARQKRAAPDAPQST